MTERISHLMDGELDDADAVSELARLRGDPALRGTWDAYHMVGDALRGHLQGDIASRVSARLAQEPTVLAPAAARPSGGAGSRGAWYALSAAASVAAVALVVWVAAPGLQSGDVQVARALNAVTAPSEVVSVPSAVGVQNYVIAHQQFSPTGAMHGVAPYARLVSEERRQ
jgi:sigma-E factor negative regulatory protein RseA